MKTFALWASALSFALVAACGNADLIVPEPLRVLDTSPGNGSLAAPGDTPIVVTFAAPIDPATLPGAVALDRTSPAGAPLETVTLTEKSYDPETATAIFTPAPLPPASYFMITVKKGTVRTANGATLTTDFTRSFRTASE